MWEDLRERGHLHDLCVDGRKILKFTFEQWGHMDWIDVDEDRVRWLAFVNAVMNFRVP
jgi:hypothetical protein